VDHALLVRVLDRLADGDEQLQAVAETEPVLFAEPRDRHPLDQLHDEVRQARGRRAGVEHPRDVRVVHQGEGLALGLEPGEHGLRVHTGPDDLERDGPADGLLLLGHVDDAHAPLADPLEQLVGPDAAPRPLDGLEALGRLAPPGLGQEAARALVRGEEALHASQEALVARAGRLDVRRPLARIVDLKGRQEDGTLVHGDTVVGWKVSSAPDGHTMREPAASSANFARQRRARTRGRRYPIRS